MLDRSITLLGTGTSQGIPVIGCDCAVCSSSDLHDKRLRCSALIRDANTSVLIDCGPDVRQQLLRAGVAAIDAVLITHEHNDHIIGLDDLRPLIFRQRSPIRVYAEPRVQESIKERFAYAFAENPYPGAPRFELCTIAEDTSISIGTLPPFQPLRVMHGQMPIVGFRMANLAYLTDVKTLPESTKAQIQDLQTLIVSSLHHRPHHSHMNLEETLDLIDELHPEAAHLIHMSHHMGLHAETAAQLPSNVSFAFDTLTLEF